jgi:anaerobic magnesium-protoporphyrin IX monomethyl ester cyclase
MMQQPGEVTYDQLSEGTSMRYEKVIVLNPPNPPGYVSNKDSMGGFGQLYPTGAPVFPTIDLVYLASCLAEYQLPTEVIECAGMYLSREDLLARLAGVVPATGEHPVLVVARTSAPTLDWDLSVCAEVKARWPAARIAIYGPVIPHVGRRIQCEPCVDYIIQGDPEESVRELMLGEPEEAIRGLTFRSADGWTANTQRPLIRALDTLPFPKWELFPIESYQLPRSSVHHTVKFLPMQTSRGCPIGCHYCPYPVGQGLLWRYRSPKNVVDEMEHLVRDLGVRYILLRDPMFSLNQKRVIQICDDIVRRGLVFEWRCETRMDFLKEETLRAMARSGCIGLNFGVESADVEIQKGVGRRPIPPEQFRTTMALCRELGIKTFAFFIIGLPGDTVDSIMKTLKFAIEVQPDWVQFTAATPFIGTKLRDWAVQHGLAAEDEYAYINSSVATMGNETLSRQQVDALHRFAHILQEYFINRKGFLKDEARSGSLRRTAKSISDIASYQAARRLYRLGKWHFERTIKTTATV